MKKIFLLAIFSLLVSSSLNAAAQAKHADELAQRIASAYQTMSNGISLGHYLPALSSCKPKADQPGFLNCTLLFGEIPNNGFVGMVEVKATVSILDGILAEMITDLSFDSIK